jgi:hypothetical protein
MRDLREKVERLEAGPTRANEPTLAELDQELGCMDELEVIAGKSKLTAADRRRRRELERERSDFAERHPKDADDQLYWIAGRWVPAADFDQVLAELAVTDPEMYEHELAAIGV